MVILTCELKPRVINPKTTGFRLRLQIVVLELITRGFSILDHEQKVKIPPPIVRDI
jgi:hypothetical protein